MQKRQGRRLCSRYCITQGRGVNELRELTHTDLNNAVQEGQLKLVLRKQKDGIVRVLPTAGQEVLKKLTPEIDLFFKKLEYKTLGQSFKKPGQVMHEKAWITYINREINKAKKSLQINDVLSSHSFRVGFVTRHLRHTDSHLVAQRVGHKNIVTTLKYNRYIVDQKKAQEILDVAYPD